MKQRFAYHCGLSAPLLAIFLGLSGCEDFTLTPPPAEVLRADAAVVVDPREIVALVPDEAAARRLLAGAEAQGFLLREQSSLDGLGLKMLRFEIPEPLDGAGAIAALEAIEPSATAGVNHAYKPVAATAENDPMDYADALMRRAGDSCPAVVPIGMMDTGIDSAIPELAGAEIHQAAFHRGASATATHGTEVASVLADPRRLQGVTLYNAAVIGRSPRGEEEAGVDSLLKALDWLAANGVRLVNISLAGPYNKLLDRGVDRAAAHGMILVAAVGNDGATSNPRYPAALDNVIAVTAVDANRAIYRDAVRGNFVDVAAPGVDIMISANGRKHFVTGTSIATPFVTARMAADPALTGAKLDTIRHNLTETSLDLGTPGADPVFGAGLILAGPACGPG